MSDHLRVYLNPAEIGPDGYPYAWHRITDPKPLAEFMGVDVSYLGIKDLVRIERGHRCEPLRQSLSVLKLWDQRARHPIGRGAECPAGVRAAIVARRPLTVPMHA